MKRHILVISMLALAAVACRREEFDLSEVPPQEAEKVQLRLEAGKPEPQGEETKTYWTGEAIQWGAGDAIKLAYTANGSWSGSTYTSEALTAAAPTAHFDVTVSKSGSAPYRFYAIYPAAAANSYSAGSHTVALTLPSAQTPVNNGGVRSFDPAADILYGVSDGEYDPWPADVDAVPIDWNRLVAHGNVTLKNLTGPITSETIEKVTLTFQRGTAIAGSFTLDLEDGSLNPDDAGNVITLDGTNLAVADGKLELWFTMAPATISSLGVIVETDKAFYSRAVGGISKEFLQNARNILGVSMSGAVRTEKAYRLVTEAPADWSGEYLIGYSSNFFAGKGDGSYATYEELTVTDNSVSYANGSSYKVVVAKTANGYSIKYGNNYVGYNWDDGSGSNYLTFNTSYLAVRDEWTFSVDAGQTMVTSVYNTDRRLKWNTSSKDRFAGYLGSSATMKDVSLFRLGGATGAGVPSFSLLKDEIEMAYTGGAHSETGVYSLVAGSDADIRLYYDDTVFSGVSVSGGTLNFTMTENDSDDPREETIVLLYADEMQMITVNQAGQPSKYVQVTSSLDDWSGKYLIGYLTNASSAEVLTGKDGSYNYGGHTTVSVSDGAIAYADGSAYEVTVTKEATGQYSMSIGGVNLYYNRSVNSNQLHFGDFSADGQY